MNPRQSSDTQVIVNTVPGALHPHKVPDGGAALALLCVALLTLAALRRFTHTVPTTQP